MSSGPGRRRFFMIDANAPGGMRPAEAQDAEELREASRGARWEPATVAAPSVREDVPLGILADDELERTAAMARAERDFNGEDPIGAGTVARAAEAEMARRIAERERAATTLDALLDSARELQATAHVGDDTEAGEARRQLRELDDSVSEQTRGASRDSVSGQVAEYVALMNEDPTPAVEREGRARREHIRAALEPDEPHRRPLEPQPPSSEMTLDEHEHPTVIEPGRDATTPPRRITAALEPSVQEPEPEDEEMER